MANYLGTDGKIHRVNLMKEKWHYHDDNEGYIRIYCDDKWNDKLFKYDKDLLDEDMPASGYIDVFYDYEKNDTLCNNPIMTGIGYEKGYYPKEMYLELTKTEKDYFQSLLTKALS